MPLTVLWLYDHDQTLRKPYDTNLAALIHEPTFKALVPPPLFTKIRAIQKAGNQAAHSQRPIRQYDALSICRELFHVVFWLARTYTRQGKTLTATFDQNLIPKPTSAEQTKKVQATIQELKAQEATFRQELAAKETALKDREDAMAEVARTLEGRDPDCYCAL